MRKKMKKCISDVICHLGGRLQTRVEWQSTLQFFKKRIAAKQVYCTFISLVPKNSQAWLWSTSTDLAAQTWQSFHFPKITVTLKMNIFSRLKIPPFHLNEIVLPFLCPQNGQSCFDLNKGKLIFWSFSSFKALQKISEALHQVKMLPWKILF